MDVNIWMVVGFLLAAYSVVANDSCKPSGPTSPQPTPPKWIR